MAATDAAGGEQKLGEQEVMMVFKDLLRQKEAFIGKIAELEVELSDFKCVCARAGVLLPRGAHRLALLQCRQDR